MAQIGIAESQFMRKLLYGNFFSEMVLQIPDDILNNGVFLIPGPFRRLLSCCSVLTADVGSVA